MSTLAISRPHPHQKRPARDLVRLVRPRQWAKNLLVVPLALLDTPAVNLGAAGRIAWAILLFCVASSFIYVINDIADRHRDRAHPIKRDRPIASGRMAVRVAAACAAGLLVLLGLMLAVSSATWPVLVYLGLNLCYCFWLKHLPLLDVFIVAIGFALRATYGYLVLGTHLSPWLLTSVFLLCLVLIVGKRRHEASTVGAEHRPSLRGYSVQYLDYLFVLTMVLTFTAFLLYLSASRFAAPYTDAALMISVPCGLFGLARYLQVVVVEHAGGDPVRVLMSDRPMLASAALWTVLLGLTLLASQHPGLVGGSI